MTVRDVSFADAYKMCRKALAVLQYEDELSEFHEKCNEYLGSVSTILEIGSQRGGNLALLGRLMKGTLDDLLISVSLSNEGALDIPRVQELVSPSRVVYFDMNSQSADAIEAVRNVLCDRLIDIIFIDGKHTYDASMSDYNNYVGFGKSRSIIGFHDICLANAGVIRTYNEIKKRYVTHECIRKAGSTNKGIGILYRG